MQMILVKAVRSGGKSHKISQSACWKEVVPVPVTGTLVSVPSSKTEKGLQYS